MLGSNLGASDLFLVSRLAHLSKDSLLRKLVPESAANFLRRQQNSKKMVQNPKIWISVGAAGPVWYAKYLDSLRLLNIRASIGMACCLLSCFNRTVFSRRSGGDSSFSNLF